MKKLFKVGLAALAVVSLVGCSKKQEVVVEEPEIEVEPAPVVEEAEEPEVIEEVPSVNCASLEEAITLAGFEVTDNENEAYSRLYSAMEGTMVQITYSDENDNIMIVRKALTSALGEGDDTSDMYNDFDVHSEVEVDGVNVTISGTEDINYLVNWNDGDYSYSAYMANGFDLDVVETLMSLIK